MIAYGFRIQFVNITNNHGHFKENVGMDMTLMLLLVHFLNICVISHARHYFLF